MELISNNMLKEICLPVLKLILRQHVIRSRVDERNLRKRIQCLINSRANEYNDGSVRKWLCPRACLLHDWSALFSVRQNNVTKIQSIYTNATFRLWWNYESRILITSFLEKILW